MIIKIYRLSAKESLRVEKHASCVSPSSNEGLGRCTIIRIHVPFYVLIRVNSMLYNFQMTVFVSLNFFAGREKLIGGLE